MIVNEVVESKELNKEAEEIQDPEEAAKVIKRYKDIIKTKIKRNYKHYISSRKIF